MNRIPPKIAVINSFAGYGRCSTTEALPIISAMRVQACPVPTAIFSNHTGFSSHYKMDFTQQMEDYLAHWDALGLVFDGIYCGFLGEKEQIPIVSSFILRQRQKGNPIVLIDPVMGDHGKTYKTVTQAHCDALTELVSLADLITPNITEGCILTGRQYQDCCWREDELQRLCSDLHAMGPKKVAITGLRQKSAQGCYDDFLNFISEQQPADGTIRTMRTVTPMAGPSRHGTGDIFASILAAGAVLGIPFPDSVKKAADFIGLCIRGSDELNIPEPDGVCFENYLDTLTRL